MGSTLTWERGRKLSTMSLANGSTASYKYNADGVRTQKTVGGVTTDYFLEGSTIVAQKTGNDVIWYYFDGDGTRDAIEYGGNVYYYMYNPQGDVIGLFDEYLNVVVEYTYDSWGKVTTTGTLKDTLGKANPFRYRGYYYDEESGMYYLNSRYYHPEICRFINADDIDILGVQGDLYDKNLFAYCDNNPTCRIDVGGYAWETVFDIASLCLSMAEVAANPQDALAWVGLAFDTLDLIPFVTGLGETAKALRLSKKGLESVGSAGKSVGYLTNLADSSSMLKKSSVKLHGNSLKSTRINYGYALIDKNNNIMKFGETINPNTRYSKKYLLQNEYTMQIMTSGSKADIHYWQYDMNMYYKSQYGIFPPLNRRGW